MNGLYFARIVQDPHRPTRQVVMGAVRALPADYVKGVGGDSLSVVAVSGTRVSVIGRAALNVLPTLHAMRQLRRAALSQDVA